MTIPKKSAGWSLSRVLVGSESAIEQVVLAELQLIHRRRQVTQRWRQVEATLQAQIRQPQAVAVAFAGGFILSESVVPSRWLGSLRRSWSWNRLLDSTLYWYGLWMQLKR